MSDTPRTDGEILMAQTGDNMVPPDFARQLERELNQLRKIVSEIATAIGNGSVVSEQASIEFMQEIPKELALYTNKLRSQQMTEEKAREVLGDWVKGIEICKDRSFNDPEYAMWRFSMYAPECISVDGLFTSLQLRAIAWWMDAKGGER